MDRESYLLKLGRQGLGLIQSDQPGNIIDLGCSCLAYAIHPESPVRRSHPNKVARFACGSFGGM